MKTEQDSKSQQEYLHSLIGSLSRSQDCKQEIFNSFTRIDLQKIVYNFNNAHEKIRKLSLKFICLLLHANSKNRLDFCRLMDIAPTEGRIVLNSFPKSVLARSQIPEILKRLKQPVPTSEETLCLVYDIALQKLTAVKASSFEEFNFVDPSDYLVLIDLSHREEKSPAFKDRHRASLSRNYS